MTAAVMILAMLIPIVMAILLAVLEPISDRGLLRRVVVVMGTTAVLTAFVVILATLLFAYAPIVRSPNTGDAAEKEQTKNTERIVQIDPSSRPGPSAPGPSDEDEQITRKGTPATQSDSPISRAAEIMPVLAAFLVAFVVVYGTARNETLLSRTVSCILAIGFSLLSTIGLARLVGYSSQMHRSATWVGAVQDTLDFTLLPCVASMFAMLFSFVLLLIGQAFSIGVQDRQAGGQPTKWKATTREDQHECLGDPQAASET